MHYFITALCTNGRQLNQRNLQLIMRSFAVMLCSLSISFAADTAADQIEISPAAAAASNKAMAYLASTQREDGSWPGSFGSTTGIVASCTLALLSGGHVPGSGEHGASTAKATQYLISCAQPNGLIYKQGMQGAPMYHHGLATLALAEIWGMTQDLRVRDTVKRAVELIVATQNRKGGWRYQPRVSDDDLSVTVMMLMALRAAKDGGILVPKETIDLGIEYVKSCHSSKESGKEGGFSYTPGNGKSGFALTGAGVLSLQVAGNYRAKEVMEGVDYLVSHEPVGKEPAEKEHYYYGQYYAAMGIYQAQSAGEWGRKAWNQWYPAITKSLISTQQADGRWSSGYDQDPTAMAVLVLNIPYRFLPIYQR
jgi:hypothetical protein